MSDKEFRCRAEVDAAFTPEEKEVEIVPFGGKQRVIGFNDLTNGYTGAQDSPTFYPKQISSVKRMNEYGFKSN